MAGGTQTTTSNTTAQPYPKAKPLLNSIIRDAKRQYKRGPADVYTGSTVTPMSQYTTDAYGEMNSIANANSGGRGMSGHLQTIMNNGGFNPDQMESMESMRNLTNNRFLNSLIDGNGLTDPQNRSLNRLEGTVNANNAEFQRLFDQGGLTEDQHSVASKYRTDMNSPFDLNANPAFQQVQDNMLRAAGQGVNAQAAAAGRYGGGANQAILGREQGKIGAQMALDEYRNWQNRGDMAAGNLANLSQGGIQNQQNLNAAQQSGLQNVANLSQMGVQNNQNAINTKAGLESTLFNMNQAGIGNMGAAYDTAMKPSQTKLGIGAGYEDLATRINQDKMRIFDAQQNAPLQHLQNYLGIAGLNGQFGTTNTVAQAPGPSPLLQGLGIAGTAGNFLWGSGTGGLLGQF